MLRKRVVKHSRSKIRFSRNEMENGVSTLQWFQRVARAAARNALELLAPEKWRGLDFRVPRSPKNSDSNWRLVYTGRGGNCKNSRNRSNTGNDRCPWFSLSDWKSIRRSAEQLLVSKSRNKSFRARSPRNGTSCVHNIFRRSLASVQRRARGNRS